MINREIKRPTAKRVVYSAEKRGALPGAGGGGGALVISAGRSSSDITAERL